MSCLGRICKRKKVKEVYVLELVNYKFYVGESYNKKRRIWVHENGNGSSWTKKHGVIQELKPIKLFKTHYKKLALLYLYINI